MPLRGSARILLPFSRRPVGTIGGLAVVLAAAGGALLAHTIPILGGSDVAQALRQSVWNEALSGQTGHEHWPWEELSTSMSLTPAASVPRLGLSAAMNTRTALSVDHPLRSRASKATGIATDATGKGDVALGDVTIGDWITFTADDGATCVYHVTGRRVVDPHLAESEAQRLDAENGLFQCGPLESLIRQAGKELSTQPQAEPQTTVDQQKL